MGVEQRRGVRLANGAPWCLHEQAATVGLVVLSADLIAATRHLLDRAGIAMAWSAAEELRPKRVIRLMAAEPDATAPMAGAGSVVVKVADGDGGTGGMVLEDLGDGPSLATLLLGDDPTAAAEGARRSAASLGALHAASIGAAQAFTALRRQPDPGYDPRPQRLLLRGRAADTLIAGLPGLLVEHDLPELRSAASAELAGVVDTLAEPGQFLVLSNGDPCPDNERVGPAGSRFFDFEVAGYRHALADAAHYRLPFPNCWCWRRLPAEVAGAMETAYRTALATACPAAVDDSAGPSRPARRRPIPRSTVRPSIRTSEGGRQTHRLFTGDVAGDAVDEKSEG